MGIWGYKLFEDDSALDIRGEFRDHLGDGLTPPQATTRMIKNWRPMKVYSDEYASFWLALAATQWDYGCLTLLAKKRALDVLDSGIGLDTWGEASPKLLAARAKVYRTLKRKLLGKQPTRKVFKKRYKWFSPWKKGWLLSYVCNSGRSIYFLVVDVSQSISGREAHVALIEWEREVPPSLAQAQQFINKLASGSAQIVMGACMALYATSARYDRLDRFKVLAKGVRVPKKFYSAVYFGGFKDLDSHLLSEYAIK